jgi:transcriptional regulator with XRE-family HTH domain
MVHEVDVHVGNRIRNQRWLKNVTQQQLAAQAGCKFQQIQKYETGANRVSASRLVMIARALDMAPAEFFEGLGFEQGAHTSGAARAKDRKEAEMMRDYRALTPKHQDAIREMIRSMA